MMHKNSYLCNIFRLPCKTQWVQVHWVYEYIEYLRLNTKLKAYLVHLLPPGKSVTPCLAPNSPTFWFSSVDFGASHCDQNGPQIHPNVAGPTEILNRTTFVCLLSAEPLTSGLAAMCLTSWNFAGNLSNLFLLLCTRN